VNSKADTNRTEILNGFPDALDLMLVCVEAGLGIDACFARVGQEVVNLHPRLARLFAGVSLELRAGRTRGDALKNMAKKSGVPEIQSFATLIVQSEKLGASIGQALKVYASEMRESRRMRAEEKAHRLPVLLSVPLVFFLLPTMVGVLGLPAVIQIMSLDI
jgi:tight adherence protein C